MSGRRGVRADLPRPQSEGSRAAQAAADSPAPLLQLPHVDMEAVKRLGRKRMRALADLAALAPDERVAQLTAAGAAPRRARSRACSPTRTARARTAASRDAHVGGARRGSPPPRAASGMPLARRALGVPKVAACRGRPPGGRGRPRGGGGAAAPGPALLLARARRAGLLRAPTGAPRAAGLSEAQAAEAATALSAVPSISVSDVVLHVRAPGTRLHAARLLGEPSMGPMQAPGAQ